MKIDKKQLFEKIMKSVNKALLISEAASGKDWKDFDYDKRKAFAADKLKDLEDSKKNLEDSQAEFEEKMKDSVEFFKELEDENKEMAKAMMDLGVDKEDQLISPEKIKDVPDATDAEAQPEPEPTVAGAPEEPDAGDVAQTAIDVEPPEAAPDVSGPDVSPPAAKRDDVRRRRHSNLREIMHTFKEWYEEG